MKRYFTYLFLLKLFASTTVLGQSIVLERANINSGYINGKSSSLQLNSSIGQVVTSTEKGQFATITQGFQQPIFVKGEVTFKLSVQNASCFGRDNGIAEVDSIEGCSAPYTVVWDNGKTGETNFGLAPGTYSVQITSDDGCESQNISFTVGVISDEPCVLKIYTGFTPNNDGFNDKWLVENLELYPTNKVSIYNRLGNKVWEGNNYDNVNRVWFGENLSGNELPANTYFYIFEAGDFLDKGWVELIR